MKDATFGLLVTAAGIFALGSFVVFISHCENEEARASAAQNEADRVGPCSDQSFLLATTAGSPSAAVCPNKRHHMRVQVASHPSNKEFGAVVFCECERETTPKSPSIKTDGGDQ